MKRREFLTYAAASAVGAARLRGAATGVANLGDSLLMLSGGEAAALRKAIVKPTGRVGERVQQLRALAERELKRGATQGEWSVTFHRPPDSKVDPHDYYSEAPYFWPDPQHPEGPYLRRDGERNPNRFVRNHDDLAAMSRAVLTLGAAAFLFNDENCAHQAAKDLWRWFIDPATRMNPNLEHGQAIRGVNDGRGTGLIDAVPLIHCSQGILLLERSGKLDPLITAALRQWFSLFTVWMTSSPKGKAESESGNNHATWWTAQIAAYSTLARNQGAFDMACQHYRDYLVPQEIRPDGSCPREEARTNSIGYSVYNADAFATFCRIAQSAGADLWRYKTPQGIGYEKVVRYLEPFVLHPDRWKKQQISPFKSDSTIFLGLAGLGLHAGDLVEAYRTLPRADSIWVDWVDLIISTTA